MNTTPTSSQGSVATDTRTREAAREVNPRDAQRQRDDFEELLRSKQKQIDDGDDNDADAAAAALLAGPPAALHAVRPQVPAHASAPVETVKTGPRAAIEAALNANAPQHVSPVGGTDPAAVWEASVREPNSVAVDVRFTRTEKTAFETQPSWTVTVGSSNVNADVLARHAPRLNEQLRKRGVGLDHVRIQRDEGDA